MALPFYNLCYVRHFSIDRLPMQWLRFITGRYGDGGFCIVACMCACVSALRAALLLRARFSLPPLSIARCFTSQSKVTASGDATDRGLNTAFR